MNLTRYDVTHVKPIEHTSARNLPAKGSRPKSALAHAPARTRAHAVLPTVTPGRGAGQALPGITVSVLCITVMVLPGAVPALSDDGITAGQSVIMLRMPIITFM